ncbi:hypothetical protein B7P43_G04670 [Cryptotermes secundus]|uniref:MYND-type domain-containing protein n=1 Tax=Cryptotermes secundus TaxID=105785 RepID=A0A2J7QZC1_9NEOP|nr:uncharacterized protein LOC111864329 isoform X2 [Cryptotermes secundus]PNF33941.1 hypothetical protein B7P43_G04670 [Cryptotermes secundus]
MRGSAVIHVENNHEGIIPHTSDVIALLPVAHQAAAEPESTFPSSALVPRTASPHLSPNLEDTSQDSLTYGYLHQQYIRAGHHKSTSAARSLRNLACRRARQTDVNGHRHMNSGLGPQFGTTDFMTAFRRGTVQPREPTVMVERLEVEVHRNGRIVPTSNGSYHILDTSEPESSSDLSAHSICVDDEIVHAYCPLDRVSVAVNSVGRGSELIDGAMERISSACDATSYSDAVKDFDCVSDLNGANVPLQVQKTTSRSYSMNNCLNKSTHESKSFERDLDINAGDNGDAGLKNVSADRQAIQRGARVCWRPVYEDISEPDSDVDSVKNTRISGMGKDCLFFTQHVNFDCNRPRNSLSRHRHSDPTDATQHKAKPLNKRRYSDPGDSARKRKEKEEKQKKRHRRWSFNTESDMYQTDHGESMKKLYLNRLLLSKDATIKSWNICIDIAHDEHTTEEFQFPEFPLPRNKVVKGEKEEKEEKEDATIIERDSSGIVDFARESSSVNKQTKSWYCSGSEIKQEMNVEDGDNVAEESPVSVPEVRTPVPGSAHNKWMVRFPSGIRNESGEQYEVPSGTRKSQFNEAGVGGKSSPRPLKIMEPLDYSSNDTSVATRVERDKRVEDVPYNLAKIMKIHGCSACMYHQNPNLASKQIKGPRGLPENLESNECRNIDSDMTRHRSSPECASGENPDSTPKNDKKNNRTADSLLPKNEDVNSASSTCAQTEKAVSLNNFDCNRNSEERGCRLHKEECCKSQISKEAFFRNLGSHPPTASLNTSAQEDVTTEQRISKSSANTSNTRSHREPINDREVKESENYVNDLDKEHSICKNNVEQTDRKHGACSEIESAAEDVKDGGESRESRESTSGRRCSSPPKIAKNKRRKARFVSTERLQHRSNKEPSGNNSITRKKSRGPRKPRFSRRNFRHDSIQMFKASTAFPPHNTLVPWRYKCNKPEFLDPLNSDSINLPSPVLKPIATETQFDGRVTNIEIQDDIPSPASLTIDLEEQNTNVSETSNLDEDERSRRKSNSDAIGADGDPVTSLTLGRRMSCEEGLPALGEKLSQAASPENQSGGIDSESSDEGQSKKRRKRVKKKKSDDTSVVVDVKQNALTAQMQEKGRRLAQELPGFNWLEEKIRNGGVTTVLPRKRLSVAPYSRSNVGSVVDTSNTGMTETPSEAIKNIPSHVPKSVSDAARSSVLPPSSSPSEYRHSKRLQEYLLRPPKRARHVSPAEASELGSQRQEVVPPLRPPTHQHAEEPSVPPASAPVSSLQRTQFPQQKSPRPVQPPSTIPDREHSPHLHHQSSRRPVIVSASELAKNSDVSPLIQQLTSGGELEVTLSTPPTSSSASSDSGVGSSSHRTSSDAELSEVMHVSIKPVHAAVTSARKGLQCTEERPRDARSEQCTSFRRMSYCVEQLSQPLHPESGSFLPRDPAPPYVYNRELPRWHDVSDLPARKVEESTGGHSETLLSAPPYGNPDKAYSDRIATMARHAATSFDTGFGMGVAMSQEACHRVPRHTQQRPFDLTHQPTSYHRENMLKTSGYIPPLAPQPGTFDSRLPQHGLFQPSYMIPQRPVKPQVVRPSAQYPAGMGPCRPSPTYLQTLTAVNSSQGLMPGIAQCSNSLIAPQSSTFSPHSPKTEMNSTVLSTNHQVPSPLSSPVQEMAPEAPQVLSQNYNHAHTSGLWSEAQASGPENQTDTSDPGNERESFNHHNKAQGSNPENRVKSSDPLTKEKNPPKDIEEIRKAAVAAAEELEKLEQLKQTTRMNLQRLKLAEEQAIEELARKQKHTEEAVEVHKAGKTVQPRPAVPSATAAATINSTPKFQEKLPLFTHERHQVPVIQDNHQSAQRPSDNADDNGSSTQELQLKLPSVTQENQKSPTASERHESGATCDNRHSEDMYENHKLCVPQNNFQSGVTLLIKQSAAAHESQQSGVAYENPPSGDAPEDLQSPVTHENHQLGASSKTQKSADVCENCQSGTGCKNQQTSGACETHQLEAECENKESALAHEYLQTGFTHKTDLIKQKSSIASDGTGNAIPRSNKTFPAVVQVNQESGATCKPKPLETTRENHETQERVNISSDSTRNSISGLTAALSAAVQENGQSDVAHENSQTQLIPHSSSAEGSMPELHTTIPMAVRENNLAQHKLDVSSNSIGKPIPGLNETFPAVAHKNQQSDVACRNHKTQEEQNVTSDSTGNSIPGLNVTFPAAALVNQQPELENKNQQPEISPRNHKMQQKVDITADNAGNSVSGVNVTFPAVVLVNKESGVEGKNGQPGVACEHYKSAVPCETHQFAQRPSTIIDTTRNSIPGLHMTYPKVSYENHQSEQRLNATVATIKNSVPALLTSHRTVGHQNREPIQRPLSPQPPPLPARSPLPAPVSLPQRPSPVQTLPMSHHITLSQSQSVPYLQTHTVVLHPHHVSIKQSPQHSHTVTAVHPPLPQLHPKLFSVPLPSIHPQFSYMPRPTLYPQLPPMPQAALHSPSLSQISPRFQLLPNSQASPHSRSLPASQASQYSQSLIKPQTDPHSQSLPVSQIFPHSQVLPLSQASKNSQSLPLPQISPHSQSLPISQALPHSHSLPVSQTSPHSRSLQLSQTSAHPHLSPVSPIYPHSQSLQLSQTSAHSQPGSASQPFHQQRLKVPLHSPSGTQPFQVLSEQQRSTENIPQSSPVQKEAMPPPTLIRQRVLPKSAQLVGSHIPVSTHSTSRCTSHQTASVPTTVHSRQSDPYVSVIPRGSVLEQPSVISQEPHVAITSSSASLSLPSNTVEECPIDLSICKRKSLSEDKKKSPSSVTSTVVQLDMNDEQNVAGLSSSSPKHHQRTQDQPTDILNPTPEECSVTNHSGLLHRDQKISQSHVSQHVPTENLRHQEQIQASETGNKRKIPSHVTSVSTANLATENYRLGMKPSIHPVTVPGSSDGKKRFETPHDQNVDDSVMHRQRVHVSTHHDTMHYSHHPVCSAHGPVPRSAYIPVYHETVFHGVQPEEQQRAHIAGLHTANVVASDRDRYWSADKQIPPTATLTPNSVTVEGDHYQRQSRLVCGRCCGTARFMCSACHNQWYCSSYCQMRHWRSHSLSCRRPTTE